MPLPVLAAALEPLADLGWSAYQVDRATTTYGPVTSSSGLTRTLHAVINYVTVTPARRNEARVEAMVKRIVAAEVAGRRSPAVWSDTSAAAREAYDLAAQARARSADSPRPAGWDTLRAITEAATEPGTRVDEVDVAGADVAAAATRSALILARARRVAAVERARRGRR